jgi:hypothetical protein
MDSYKAKRLHSFTVKQLLIINYEISANEELKQLLGLIDDSDAGVHASPIKRAVTSVTHF